MFPLYKSTSATQLQEVVQPHSYKRQLSLPAIFSTVLKKKEGEKQQDRACFSIFQTLLTEQAALLPNDCYTTLDKHCHKNSALSSISGQFVYRGVRASCTQDRLANLEDGLFNIINRTKMRKIAVAVLKIPQAHVSAIDLILQDLQSFRTSTQSSRAKMHRCARLADCIHDKLRLKKLLSVSVLCLNCELETMAMLQYEILQQMLCEETEITAHVKNARDSLDSIKQSGSDAHCYKKH
jgi:hypothetical protein